jgi:hypothetical protein
MRDEDFLCEEKPLSEESTDDVRNDALACKTKTQELNKATATRPKHNYKTKTQLN